MYQACPRCHWKLFDQKAKEALQVAYPKSYTPWTLQEDVLLHDLARDGASILEMQQALERPGSSIKARISKMGMVWNQKVAQVESPVAVIPEPKDFQAASELIQELIFKWGISEQQAKHWHYPTLPEDSASA